MEEYACVCDCITSEVQSLRSLWFVLPAQKVLVEIEVTMADHSSIRNQYFCELGTMIATPLLGC